MPLEVRVDAISQGLAGNGFTESSRTKVKAGNVAGLELIVRDPLKGESVRARYALSGDGLYCATATCQDRHRDNPRIQHFLESFTIVEQTGVQSTESSAKSP